MAHIFFNGSGGNNASSDSESVPQNRFLGVTNMTDRVVNITLTTSGTLTDNADETYNNLSDVVVSLTGTSVELRMPAGSSYFLHNQSGTCR